MQINEELLCPGCKRNDRITKDNLTNELICNQCGAIIKFEDDTEFEKEQMGRKPNSNLYANRGVFGFIGKRDYTGAKIPSSIGLTLRDIDDQVKSNSCKARGTLRAMRVIRTICDQMSLPENVLEEIGWMYQKYYSKNFSKGRRLDVLLAVYAYIICRKIEIRRNRDEFIKVINCKAKEFNRLYNAICVELGYVSDKNIPFPSPEEVITTARNKLKLPVPIERKALELLKHVRGDLMLVGKNPKCVGAAILWYAITLHGRQNITTQDHLSAAIDITAVALRNNVKRFSDRLEEVNSTMTK